MEQNENWELENTKIEPFTLVYDILSNWWVILLGAIAAALLANVVVNMRYVPQYTTSVTYAVSSQYNTNALNNLSATNEMAQTFQSILKSNAMNKIICEELGVNSVNAQISANIMGETNLLVLSVTAPTSKEAVDVIQVIMNNYEKVSYYALGSSVMDVLASPEVPIYPDNPLNVTYEMQRAFFVAAAALVLVFGLLSYFRDTVKSEQDVERKLDARNLGVIVYERKYKTIRESIKNKKKALLVNNPLAGFAFVEGYKKLATKVEYQMKKHNVKAVVVTSVSENEGKSTVAANLAISLAEQSKKVLLMEGDLRRPSQFLILNKDLSDKQEIGEYLDGNVRVKDIVIKSEIPNLYLALGRNCYSSSTEKIQSEKMGDLIAACQKIVDYVIIDSPPTGLIGDAEILAKYAGSVLLVTKQNHILAEDVNEVLDTLRSENSKVLGVVLNRVRSFSNLVSGGNYGYYGKYGKYGKYGNYLRDRGNE